MNQLGILKVAGQSDTKAIKRIQYVREEIRYIELLRDIFKTPINETRLTSLQLEYAKLCKDHPLEVETTPKPRSIGDQLQSFGDMARHDYPVLAYRPVADIGGVKRWLDMVDGDHEIIVTPYYVGCQVELIYQGGGLHRAITKGGGIMGNDFTAKAYVIDGIPQQISETERVSIRGVVTAKKEVVEGYKMPQIVATTLMTSHFENGALNEVTEGLVFIPDDIHIPGTTFSTIDLRSISLAWDFYGLNDHRFPGNRKEIGYLDELLEAFRKKQSDALPIQGWLFTVNSMSKKMELGYTSAHPEWAILLTEAKPDAQK